MALLAVTLITARAELRPRSRAHAPGERDSGLLGRAASGRAAPEPLSGNLKGEQEDGQQRRAGFGKGSTGAGRLEGRAAWHVQDTVSSGGPENRAIWLLSAWAMANDSNGAPGTFPGSLGLEEEEIKRDLTLQL